jgi:pre-mRNA-splicing factor ATP-dependent RNA helicase DHX38/PRP16
MLDESIPEVQRTNLANTILYLKAIGIRNILEFDFLDPPSEEQVLQALIQLYMLKAIDYQGDITPLGRKMSNFPLDPCLSRMLIESATK